MTIKFQCLPYTPLRVTSPFGPRHTGIPGASAYHRGVDLGADKSRYKGATDGGPVRAVLPGRVASSYYNKARGWVVLVDHGTVDGCNIKTLYQHLKQQGAPAGRAVRAGDVIGTMGNTGVGAQLHLHFEMRISNICVDPAPYLKEVKAVDEDRVREIIKEILAGADTKVSSWAKKDWEAATAAGVTDGGRPGGYCTREQVVAMLERSKG